MTFVPFTNEDLKELCHSEQKKKKKIYRVKLIKKCKAIRIFMVVKIRVGLMKKAHMKRSFLLMITNRYLSIKTNFTVKICMVFQAFQLPS